MSKCFQSISKISLKGPISTESTDVTVSRTFFIDTAKGKGPLQLKSQTRGIVGEASLGVWFLAP